MSLSGRSLRNRLTAELGHALGLGYAPCGADSLLAGCGEPGSELRAADIDAFCSVYGD